MGEPQKSKGHVAFGQGREFILGRDESLYCAPIHNRIGLHGFRVGARFECKPRKDGHAQYLKSAWDIDITKEQD